MLFGRCKWTIWVPTLLALIVALSACGGASDTNAPVSTTTTSQVQVSGARSTPTPTPTFTSTPTFTPTPATLLGLTPFVGKWWIGDGARIMTINPDGTATYTEGSSQEAMIQFNRIQGNTAFGVVVGGTGFMPNGSSITVTLVGTSLQVSDGMLLCPSTDQCAN